MDSDNIEADTGSTYSISTAELVINLVFMILIAALVVCQIIVSRKSFQYPSMRN